MLRNYVAETSNAPGTASTINLAGAVSGRIAFAAVFTNGASCFYYMTDGTQAEWGIGTFASGTPNQLARTTVLGNTAGGTSRLNFTSSSTSVYNDIPAERALYADASQAVALPGNTTIAGSLTVATGITLSTGSFTLQNGGITVQNGGISVTGGAISGSGGLAITGGGAISGGLTLPTGSLVQAAGNAPASSSASGTPGQFAWDGSYFYLCVATNSWRRIAWTTF